MNGIYYFLAYLVAFALTALFATASYRLMERRFLSLRKNFDPVRR
jgi:peptidoglycan/LPS O-acetylase OafA/YrhL